jgi:hypothetical protein
MYFIHCGNISIYSLFYLFYSIFSILDYYLTSPKLNELNQTPKKSEDDNINLSITFILIMFISEFLNGIIGNGFLKLLKYSNKKEDKDRIMIFNIINIENQIISNNPIGRECYKKWVKIFIVSIFDSISTFATIYDDVNGDLQKINIIFYSLLLIFVALFSSFYLKYALYRHHIFGLFIVILGYFFNNIFAYKSLKYDFYIIILFLTQLINAWREIFEKDLIEIHFLGIYELLTIEGLMGFIFSILMIIFLQMLGSFNYSIRKIENVIIIIFFISCGCFNIFRLKINQIYSPIHRCVGDNFALFIIWIINLFKEKNNYVGFEGIGFIFCIFGTLIFTEMISISVCNLDFYTRKEQVKRANNKLRYNDFIL